MSNRRQRLIIAPESPPATPPREGQHAWQGNHQYYANYPRAVVERSVFRVPNHSSQFGRIPRSSSSRHSSSYANSSSPHRVPNPSSMGTPVFRLEEDLPQHPFTNSRVSRRSGRVGSLRRSESLDFLPRDEDPWHGRYSESEPPKAGSNMLGLSTSPQHGSSSGHSRRSMEFQRPARRSSNAPPPSRSKPIPVPSRKKVEEERKRKHAADEKKKAAAERHQQASSQQARSSSAYRRRSINSDTKYGLHYSSSDESDDYSSTR